MGSVTPAARSKPSRRFLRCFKSEINDGDAHKYMVVGEKEGIVFPNVLPVLKPAKENDVRSVSRRRKEGSGNSFARIMRAVVFETALAKKMRKRKTKHKSFRTEMIGDEPTKPPAMSRMKKSASESELTGIGRSYLTETSTGSSSSSLNIGSGSTVSASSLISSARSSPSRTRGPPISNPPDPKTQSPKSKLGRTRYTIIGLFSVLLSLVSVIFWGKACAIFCTFACLFVVPRLSRSRSEFSPPGSVPVPADIGADEQKKRVVVDGFLDRGRGR